MTPPRTRRHHRSRVLVATLRRQPAPVGVTPPSPRRITLTLSCCPWSGRDPLLRPPHPLV
jgi:hypothetical protein